MDIDLLSKMVKELILDNDKVVLPSLGSFVAEVVPSTFSDKGYTINPPYRKLYFRAKPDQGDALALFYAKSNNIQEDVAQKIISDFISELKAVLFERKTVVFPGLGRLRATKENTVFFVADEDLDIYPEGFGLEPVSMKTHVETREEVAAAVQELKAIVAEEPVVEEPVEGEPVAEVPVEEVPEEDTPEEEVVEIEVPTVEEMVVNTPEQVKKKPGFWKVLGRIVLWLLLVSALLLGAFIAVSRLRPDLTDRILYSPEELELINRQ